MSNKKLSAARVSELVLEVRRTINEGRHPKFALDCVVFTHKLGQEAQEQLRAEMLKGNTATTIVVLMTSGEQHVTQLPVSTLHGIGDALRKALAAGPVDASVIVTSAGISRYTAGETKWLAEHPQYR